LRKTELLLLKNVGSLNNEISPSGKINVKAIEI
jgi:hypothetical protein